MRAPLDGTIRVTPHGAYGYDRGDHIHKGVDLAAAEGTIVKAPERGLVLVAANRNDLKPFSRYGPAFVYMKGFETGLFHLLAHLKLGSIRTAGGGYPGTPSMLTLGNPYPVAEGQYLGVISDRNHLHWEINPGSRVPIEEAPAWQLRGDVYDVRGGITLDPMKVLRETYAEPQTELGGGSILLLLAALWLLKDN